MLIGKKAVFVEGELLSKLGTVDFCGLSFEFFEGRGGHVKGETVIYCEELKLVFTGDIFVNIKGFSEEQKEFNSIAPFLMTGVETNAVLAKQTRDFVMKKFSGNLICPGHGATFCAAKNWLT